MKKLELIRLIMAGSFIFFIYYFSDMNNFYKVFGTSSSEKASKPLSKEEELKYKKVTECEMKLLQSRSSKTLGKFQKEGIDIESIMTVKAILEKRRNKENYCLEVLQCGDYTEVEQHMLFRDCLKKD